MKINSFARLGLAAGILCSLSLLGGCGNKDADTTAASTTSGTSAKTTDAVADPNAPVKAGGGAGAKAPFDPSK